MKDWMYRLQNGGRCIFVAGSSLRCSLHKSVASEEVLAEALDVLSSSSIARKKG